MFYIYIYFFFSNRILKSTCLDEDDVSASEEVEEEFDWFYEQKLPEPDTDPLNLLNVVKYGFANQHSGVFKNVQVFILYNY